ncbi:hypothetical protein V8F20_006796 [Naviculisporaceae sp. PSN 640]
MTKNKDRLYVALYARGGGPTMPGGEDKYHWALLTGPKNEQSGSPGNRMHAREYPSPTGSTWAYEHRDITMNATNMILVRIVVGKITNMNRLLEIVGNVPIRGNVPGWNCVEWVREALQLLGQDDTALGTKVTDWQTVRDAAMEYAVKKAAEHRFDGTVSTFDTSKVPTYCLLTRKEIQK